jgi:hypothetical protein
MTTLLSASSNSSFQTEILYRSVHTASGIKEYVTAGLRERLEISGKRGTKVR